MYSIFIQETAGFFKIHEVFEGLSALYVKNDVSLGFSK